MKKVFLSFVLCFCLGFNLFGQIDSDYRLKKGEEYIVGQKYIYEFRDGTIAIGTYIKSGEGNIYITDLEGEEIYMPKIMVAQVHKATKDNLKGDEYIFPNLHDTRYFFSPTAFGLKEGEGYYNHSFWALWQCQYGINDNFSIGGGTTPMGIPATLNAKLNGEISKGINVAAGWFWVGDLFGWSGADYDERTLINMPYGVVTYGNKENNFTLGAGFNLSDQFSGDDDRFVLNGGATFRAGRRFAFIFEGWIFQPTSGEPTFMGGPGIRYFRKINRVTARNGAGASTWDIQLLTSPDMDGIIPLFGASRKF